MAKVTNEPGNYAALGPQSAIDTPATSFYFFKHLSGTEIDPNEQIETEREGGDGQEAGLRYRSLIAADGQVVHKSRPAAVGRMLVYALGQEIGGASLIATMAAAPSAIYARVAAPAASLPYLTYEQRAADEIERVLNVKVTDLSIEGESGKKVSVTGQLIGGGSYFQRDVASTLTPVRETLTPHNFAFGSYVIDGVGNAQLTKFKINPKRAVDTGIQTTGITRQDAVELNADYNIDFTLKYGDRTLNNKVVFNGGSVVPVDLATGSWDMTLLDSSGSYPLRVVMPLIQYVDAKPNRLDPDGKTVYIDVSAMSIKNATHALFAVVMSSDPTSYLLG